MLFTAATLFTSIHSPVDSTQRSKVRKGYIWIRFRSTAVDTNIHAYIHASIHTYTYINKRQNKQVNKRYEMVDRGTAGPTGRLAVFFIVNSNERFTLSAGFDVLFSITGRYRDKKYIYIVGYSDL